MGWLILAIIGLGIAFFAMDSFVLIIYEIYAIIKAILTSRIFWIIVVVVAIAILVIHFHSNRDHY